jgi:hypothetical protein
MPQRKLRSGPVAPAFRSLLFADHFIEVSDRVRKKSFLKQVHRIFVLRFGRHENSSFFVVSRGMKAPKWAALT